MLMDAHVVATIFIAIELLFVWNSKSENNKGKYKHVTGEQGSRVAL